MQGESIVFYGVLAMLTPYLCSMMNTLLLYKMRECKAVIMC